MPAKKNGNGKELVEVTDNSDYLALEQIDGFKDLVQQNIGSSGVAAFELDRIKVPAGGGIMWTINTLEGEEAVKDIEGIIVHMTEPRSFWATAFDEGGGSAPDCQSEDGVLGVGTRFEDDDEGPHNCPACKFSQFGSDAKGRGQACKATKAIFMLMPNTMLPVVLTLPPGSLFNAKKYFLRLLSHGRSVDSVITKWELDKDQNPDGIKYSKAVPSSVRTLEPEEHLKVKNYADIIRPYLGQVRTLQDESSD